MTTRIYHRIDTEANWNSAISSGGGGQLAKGEIGIVRSVSGETTVALGYLGINDTPTDWNACPMVFYGYINDGVAETITSEPVIYERPASTPPAGSTLAWDSSTNKWTVDELVLNLDAYPSSDGTVLWNQSLGKFQVGAAVSAVELDGGEYTAA